MLLVDFIIINVALSSINQSSGYEGSDPTPAQPQLVISGYAGTPGRSPPG
jgi:hypothetical protein